MAPAGTAMRETTEYGRLRNWVPQQKELKETDQYHLIFVCTGSQCEPGAALPRALEGTARDINLLPNDWVVDIQGAIPHYIAEIKKMYQEILSRFGQFGRLVISKSEARRLGLGKHPKIIYADDLLGRPFDMSSGHGRLDDQKLLLEAAQCTDLSRQVGYQSEDDQPAIEDCDIPEPLEPDTQHIDYTALRERLLHILTA
ncbi:hypothetical protein HY065_02730 [Candidatus Berkelbacteria bacterium]|nr:hypothetical protein [Candidatus Berkelbacteria bacterium]